MKPSWNVPPTRLLLSRHELHIWRAGLDLPGESLQKLKETLSIDERARAESFHFERDRNRFIAARGVLRLVLASYLGVEPGAIRFSYEKEGKPRLQNGSGKAGIQFNLSHSEGLALYAFTRGHEVGVDVEYLREIPEMEQIAEQFFSARERAFFSTLSATEKQQTFINWWTRKEAYIKAIGEGLYHPLDTFDASLILEKQHNPLSLEGDPRIASPWLIQDLEPASRYMGAFAVKKRTWTVHYWIWANSSTKDYELKQPA